jgi:predicted dehydrogenase
MALMALEAGKDVFCEKPPKYISECFAVEASVKKYQAVFQTGLEDRSTPHYHKMIEWSRNGALGDVQRIEVTLPALAILPAPAKDVPIPADVDYNLFAGPAPLIPFQSQYLQSHGWRAVRNFGTGSILDWGSHMFDTAQLCANAPDQVPVEVSGKGVIPTGSLTDVPVEYDADLTYSNGVVINIKHGGTSIKVIGSKGWVGNDKWLGQLKSSDEAILKTKYSPQTSKYRQIATSEHKNFIACVKSRETTTYPVETMHSIHLGLHAADISIRLGRKVRWDAKQNVFIDDAEANKLAIAPTPRDWQKEG